MVVSEHKSESLGSMGDQRLFEPKEPTCPMKGITGTVLINDPSRHRQDGSELHHDGHVQFAAFDRVLGSERQLPPTSSSILAAASASVEIAWEVLMCFQHPDDCRSFRLRRLCNELLCTFLFLIYYCCRGIRRTLAKAS
jgi:hypothetical protein